MSDNTDIHSFDYDAHARQVLSQKPLLSAKDLEVTFSLRGNRLVAIRRASLDLYKGETLAIVGESGSGKSVFTIVEIHVGSLIPGMGLLPIFFDTIW